MPRRSVLALARILRLTALATLIWSMWLVATTPLAQYYTRNTSVQLDLALQRVLRREFDADWLNQTLGDALEAEPTDWVLIESSLAIANQQDLTPSAEIARAVLEARDRQRNTAGLVANCLACASGDASCRLEDGLTCALGVELTPIGDARALIAEGQAYARGEPVDNISVALAGVGLGATLAIIVSGGTSAAVKGGVAVLRIARRAGRLSPGLQARLARIGTDLVDWRALPRSPAAMMDPAVYRAAVNRTVLAAGTMLVTDLVRVRRAVPATHALRILPRIDTLADARRMGDIASLAGAKTVAVLHRLGKARALRLTLRLSRVGRTLAGLALALAFQAAGLVLARVLGGTARALRAAAR